MGNKIQLLLSEDRDIQLVYFGMHSTIYDLWNFNFLFTFQHSGVPLMSQLGSKKALCPILVSASIFRILQNYFHLIGVGTCLRWETWLIMNKPVQCAGSAYQTANHWFYFNYLFMASKILMGRTAIIIVVSHISLLDLSIISRLIWIHQVQDNIFSFIKLLRSYTYWHKFPTFGSGARGQDKF